MYTAFGVGTYVFLGPLLSTTNTESKLREVSAIWGAGSLLGAPKDKP
jgi:hypothetical protein